MTKYWMILQCVLLSCSFAQAQDDSAEDGAGTEKPAIYLPLKPSFVVNYGNGERLKYLKADVTVRLDNTAAANSVRHHLPFIRNNLVMLFASQTDEGVTSQAGKEALRAEALRQIKDIILKEDDIEGVVDVYFNRLIVQR